MLFRTEIEYRFIPRRGHRLVIHLASSDKPELRFELPYGLGAFHHFRCELLKSGLKGAELGAAETAAMVAETSSHLSLPSLDLDDDSIRCLVLNHSMNAGEALGVCEAKQWGGASTRPDAILDHASRSKNRPKEF